MKKKLVKTTDLEGIIELWYTKNLDIAERTIYFGPWQPNEDIGWIDWWEVNDWTAQNLMKGLYILEQLGKGVIKIIWASEGGYWDAGIQIYDFIKHIKSPVEMLAYGRIKSMGTIILQACQKRFLAPHCEFMIHYGTAEANTDHTKNIINWARELERIDRVMETIYLSRIREKHPRYKREDFKELIKYDKYMRPQEAIAIGLADKIIL